MEARLTGFGEISIDGQSYQHDVVIEAGRVRKRRKKPSKALRGASGHTPLSAAEEIPWGGERLIVGTGMYGSLPVLPEVFDEARRRGVEVVAVPTEEACGRIAELEAASVFAILHVTC